jgi:hypothetical protein
MRLLIAFILGFLMIGWITDHGHMQDRYDANTANWHNAEAELADVQSQLNDAMAKHSAMKKSHGQEYADLQTVSPPSTPTATRSARPTTN